MANKAIWAAGILACGMWSAAQAQADAKAYPNRPITMVVPAAAGGATDVVARVMAEQLGKRLGQTVLVDNKTGASGTLGANAVARAAPDGHTLLLSYSTPIFYAHHTIPKMSYNVEKDFAFITQVAATSLIILVNEKIPVHNMKEFMAWVKANPGKINYGSYSPGSPGHLMSAYLSESRKLSMTHVAYKSEAPLIQDLAGGVVPWGMGTLAAGGGMIKSGKLRPIAVLGPNRLKDLPNVPTMAEQGFPDPEFNTVAWFTLLAPAGTPKPILDRLEKEAVEVIHSSAMKARFQVLGLESVKGGSAQFHKDFKAVDPLIAKLVNISGVKAE